MENTNQYTELIAGWQNLCFETKKRKKVDFGFFKEIFSKTYDVLAQVCAQDAVSKDLAGLISEAFLFAKLDLDLDSKYLATLVLTERMLDCCAFGCAPTVPERTTAYMVQTRKSVNISFKDIDESINTLERVMESVGPNLQ